MVELEISLREKDIKKIIIEYLKNSLSCEIEKEGSIDEYPDDLGLIFKVPVKISERNSILQKLNDPIPLQEYPLVTDYCGTGTVKKEEDVLPKKDLFSTRVKWVKEDL